MKKPILVLLACIMLVVAACEYPKDAGRTLEAIKTRPIRAGISENPPWTYFNEGGPAGVEARMIEAFASDLGATVKWIGGSEGYLLEALKARQLDIVAAGLTDKSPWAKQVAFTKPYFTAKVVVGAPEDMRLDDVAGMEVAVKEGSVVAYFILKKHGRPVHLADPSAYPGPVAAYEWQLIGWNKTITSVVLRKEKHVLAVPPGENAWLLQVDRFLLGRKRQIQEWIEENE